MLRENSFGWVGWVGWIMVKSIFVFLSFGYVINSSILFFTRHLEYINIYKKTYMYMYKHRYYRQIDKI